MSKQNPIRTKNIWNKNSKIAEDLARAYYESLIAEYGVETIKKDSKENVGFNTFCDGIRLGLDVIMPLLDNRQQKEAIVKINDLLKIRKEKKN